MAEKISVLPSHGIPDCLSMLRVLCVIAFDHIQFLFFLKKGAGSISSINVLMENGL